MMGPTPIPLPEYFNTEYLKAQKELKKTDAEIAGELAISVPLLSKWKREVGWESGSYRHHAGRKRSIDYQEVISLVQQGLTQKKVAEMLGVSVKSVAYILRKTRSGEHEGAIH